MADCRVIADFKQQKKACIKAIDGPGKKSLALLFLFEEINELKRQLKPEKTASSKKSKAASILFTGLNLNTSCDKGEEYLLTFLNPLALAKPS
jgi:hypothetical protein